MEFWQGEHRLHDRFLYQRENGGWKIDTGAVIPEIC
jgi:pyridoxamine 5'-phosphate oxidase